MSIVKMAKAEVFVDGTWVSKDYNALVKGDIFRVYKDGKLSDDGLGHTEFVATSNAYTTDNGFNYQVDCDLYTPKK